jgi:hypothetical protein
MKSLLRIAADVASRRSTRARLGCEASQVAASARRSGTLCHSGVRRRRDLSSFSPFLRPGSPTSAYRCASSSAGAARHLKEETERKHGEARVSRALVVAEGPAIGTTREGWTCGPSGSTPQHAPGTPCCMCRVQAPQLASCVRGSDWGTIRVRVRKRWCSCQRDSSARGHHRLVEQLRVDAKEVEVELLQRAEVQGRRVRHERLRCVRLVDLETILLVQAQVAHIRRTHVLRVGPCVRVAKHVRYT